MTSSSRSSSTGPLAPSPNAKGSRRDERRPRGDPDFPKPAISVALVLDRCTDASAFIAARWPAFETIACDAREAVGVGAARRARVRHLLPAGAVAAARTWIATTDADSEVPPNWLTTQLTFARKARTALIPVLTSARLTGRTPAGFAGYLRAR